MTQEQLVFEALLQSQACTDDQTAIEFAIESVARHPHMTEPENAAICLLAMTFGEVFAELEV